MNFSSLEHLTVQQLRAVAKHLHISLTGQTKKTDIISQLINYAPSSFDEKKLDEFLIDKKNNSVSSSITLVNIKEEIRNHDISSFESALFDVTNDETKKFKGFSPKPTFQTVNAPKFTATQNRFGPKAKTDNSSTLSVPLPKTMDMNSGSKPAFTQAYSAEMRSNIKKDENLSPIIYNISKQPLKIQEPENLLKEEKTCRVKGNIQIQAEGYGLIKSEQHPFSVYVSNGMIKKFHIQSGDIVQGTVILDTLCLNYAVMIYIHKVDHIQNNINISEEGSLESIKYPETKIKLNSKSNILYGARLVDFISPLYLGARALIVGHANCGTTSLMMEMTNSLMQSRDTEFIYISIDVPIEEINYLKTHVDAKLYCTSFNESPQTHIQKFNEGLQYAQTVARSGLNAILFVDSFTRVLKQMELFEQTDDNALALQNLILTKAKQFFSVGRQYACGGTLTLITSMCPTSYKDGIVLHELLDKATNVLYMSEELSESFLFPAIDLKKSCLKKPIHSLTPAELEIYQKIHKVFNTISTKQAHTQFIDLLLKTKTNRELKEKLPKWLVFWDSISDI